MTLSRRLSLLSFVLALGHLFSPSAWAQPYTRGVYNRSATESVVCLNPGTMLCTMNPTTCGPGQDCTVTGYGFMTMQVASGASLKWDFTLRNSSLESYTGPTSGLNRNLYDFLSVTLHDIPAGDSVSLSVDKTSMPENGGTATITATRSGTLSASPTNVTIDYYGSTATLSEPPVSWDDFAQSGAARWEAGPMMRYVYTFQIPANQRTGTLTLASRDDSVVEPDEKIQFSIYLVDSATWVNPPTPLSVMIDDDDRKVTLSVDNTSIPETGGVATVTASISPVNAAEAVTVSLGFTGTATMSTDYTVTGTSITIPAGQTSASRTINVVSDTAAEPDETVIIDITGVTNASEQGIQQATVTIVDDDVPQVSLELAGSPIAENNTGIATVTARLDRASYQVVTVDLAFTGTATNGTDYSSSASSISIPIGSLTGSVTLTGIPDTLDEPDETVIVDITGVTNAVGAGTQQVTATIIDDDAPPTVTLSLAGSPLAETGGVATVKALLSGPSSLPVTVTLGLTGTATYSDDYVTTPAMPPAPIELVIPAGTTEATLTLTAAPDALDEPDETVIVDITGVTNATESGTQQVTATIADDDPTPSVTLSLAGSPLAEAGGIATVTALLSGPSGQPVTVNLGFSGTATNVSDYNRSAESITIAAGSLSGTVTLSAVDDTIDEPDETVIVDVTVVTNATESGTQQVTATIVDDDATTVTLALAGSPLPEAGGVATVTATLSTPSAGPVTVHLGFSGTTDGLDYTASATSITIAPGATTGSITLTGNDDALYELDETVIVDITTVDGGAVEDTSSGQQQVTATITDDDAPPTVTLSLAGSPFAESGGIATVTALLSGPSGLPVTVDLGFGGTATNGSDYNRSADSITIPSGSLSGTVTLSAVDDTIDEPDETVIIDITGVTNGTESGTQQVTATIADDDAPPTVTLSLAGSPLAETGGVATVKALLSGPSGLPVTVTLGLSGSATYAADYTTTPPAPIALVIPAGATEGTLTLTAAPDALDELDETVIVDITGVTNGTESGTQQVMATIADDDAPPTVTLSLAGSPLAESGGIATVKALLSGPSALPVTVTLGFSGTATNGIDYNRSAESIAIAPGNLSGTATLTAVDDTIHEPDETVIVDVTAVTNAIESGVQQVTATIADDDTSTVTLALAGSPLAEAGGIATVTATLSRLSSQAVTVDLALGGTASATDYTATATRIVIPAGSTSGSITLRAVDDTVAELDETVIVEITSVTNALENGTQQVTVTIIDDDPARLAFATQPSTSVAGQLIAPAVTVQVLDSSNRLVPASAATVTLALGTNPALGSLMGTLTVAAVGGVATFANVAIDAYGDGYTLVASSGGLAGATSVPFEITPSAVTTFSGPSVTGTGIVSVSFTGGGRACTFVDPMLLGQAPGAVPLPPTFPPGLVFPHGLFRFQISNCAPGADVTFTITYPEPLPPGTRYWKYGPPSAGAAPVWYQLPATIDGDKVTFTIVDGGLGDEDGLANGTLRDPGGPAVLTVPAIPTLPEWGLWLMVLLLVGLGLLHIRPSSGS